jgi:hypothetical protein
LGVVARGRRASDSGKAAGCGGAPRGGAPGAPAAAREARGEGFAAECAALALALALAAGFGGGGWAMRSTESMSAINGCTRVGSRAADGRRTGRARVALGGAGTERSLAATYAMRRRLVYNYIYIYISNYIYAAAVSL